MQHLLRGFWIFYLALQVLFQVVAMFIGIALPIFAIIGVVKLMIYLFV